MNLPDHTSESPSHHGATDVQFSTRSLLIIMAVVAVAATSLGVFIRSFPEDVRLSLAAYWSFLIVTIIGVIIYHARKRYIAEQQAGRVLFILPTHSYFLPRIPQASRLILATLFLIIGPALWIENSLLIAQGDWKLVWISYCTYLGPVTTGTGITMFWWRNVRLAERGVVIRSKFVPWVKTKHWYWDACDKNVVVIESREFGKIAAIVEPKDRSGVDSRLPGRR
jgi:hypothetical protein